MKKFMFVGTIVQSKL